MEIYERGVTGIPHSVDLWTHYCTYFAEKFENLDDIRGYDAVAIDWIITFIAAYGIGVQQ